MAVSTLPGPATTARARAVTGWGLALAGTGATVLWLRYTGGDARIPAGLLACPLHETTGLWCPFCGGLRCVAEVARGDLTAAASFNVVVLALLPVLALWWSVAAWSAVRGRTNPLPRLDNRAWLVLGAVLLLFTVWRNLPALPLGTYLAP